MRHRNRAPPPVPVEPVDPPLEASPAALVGSDTTTQLALRKVDFRLSANIVMHVRRMRGEMYSTVDSQPTIVLGNKLAFAIRIFAADAFMTPSDLTHLMNDWVFAYTGAPFKDMRVTIARTQLRMTGVLARRIDVPFEIVADVEATPKGIRLRPTSIKVADIQSKGAMKLLGIKMDELFDLKGRAARRSRGTTCSSTRRTGSRRHACTAISMRRWWRKSARAALPSRDRRGAAAG